MNGKELEEIDSKSNSRNLFIFSLELSQILFHIPKYDKIHTVILVSLDLDLDLDSHPDLDLD